MPQFLLDSSPFFSYKDGDFFYKIILVDLEPVVRPLSSHKHFNRGALRSIIQGEKR
jgi:hypothetical protein